MVAMRQIWSALRRFSLKLSCAVRVETVVFMLFPMSYVLVVDLASEVLEDQKGEDGDDTEQHP